MNKRIKKKWLKALRSGEYQQVQNELRKIDNNGNTIGFCCLGVLCNIHAQKHPNVALGEKDPSRYLGMGGTLPTIVQDWAGLSDGEGGNVVYKGRAYSLVDLNDILKLSFKKIANIVEKQL